MTDLLGRLAARALVPVPGLRPALPPRFAAPPEPRHEPEEALVRAALRPDRAGGPATGRSTVRDEVERPAAPEEVVRAASRAEPAGVAEEPPQRTRSAPTESARRPLAPRRALRPEPAQAPKEPAARSGPEGDRAGSRRRSPEPEARAPVPAPEPRRAHHRSRLAPRGAEGPTPASPPPRSWSEPPLVPMRAPDPGAPTSTLRERPASTRARDGAPAEPPSVVVSIGRIEIRGPESPEPAPSPSAWTEAPLLTMADYARRRGGTS